MLHRAELARLLERAERLVGRTRCPTSPRMIARTWSGSIAVAVGAVGGQRLADVGDGEDARVAVELLVAQAEVVAAAVEPLVVRAGGGGEVAGTR